MSSLFYVSDKSSERAFRAVLGLRAFLRRRPTFVLEVYSFGVVLIWSSWFLSPGDHWGYASVALATFARIGELPWIVGGAVVLSLPVWALVRHSSRILTAASVGAGLWSATMSGTFALESFPSLGALLYGWLAIACFSPLWLRAAGLFDES